MGLTSVGRIENFEYIWMATNGNGVYPRLVYGYVNSKSAGSAISPELANSMVGNPIHYQGIRIEANYSGGWRFQIYAEKEVEVYQSSGWVKKSSGTLIATIYGSTISSFQVKAKT